MMITLWLHKCGQGFLFDALHQLIVSSARRTVDLTANTRNKRRYERGEKFKRTQRLVKFNQLWHCQESYGIDSDGGAGLSFL